MSKIIIYGGTQEARSALADKIVKGTPDHNVISGWDGETPVEPKSIVLADVMPPFYIGLDYLVVGVGAHAC